MKIHHLFNATSALALLVLAGQAQASGTSWQRHHHSAPITVVPAAPAPSPTPTAATTAATTTTTTTTTTAAAQTTSNASSATRVAIYVGNSTSDLNQFQSWLGRGVDAIELHGDHSSWSAMMSNFSWQASLFRPYSTDIIWSVPLIPTGATLDAAAAGSYDANYKAMAQQFLNQWPNDQQIYIRVGWEFNGTGYFPWCAVGKATQYINAYRHFVNAFRSVSATRFKFEWTPNIGSVGMDPTTAYPGDAYVDVIGMDFYYNTKWLGTDPTKAWNYVVSEKWGLQWQQDFAAQHKKPTAYSEWAVNSDGAGPYITLANQWFAKYHVLYQSYWNSNSTFPGDLSDNQYPHAAATYKSIFGKQAKAGAIVVP